MKLITLQAQLQYNSRTTPYEGKGGGEIKIQTLNLKKMYRNYRKISRFKKQYLKMDFWVNNPKNKMHLAWKLVFTHLYMPDAIIYIHDISVILQKIGRKAWHKGHAISWQHEGKQKKRQQLFFFLPLCWEILTLIWQKLPWSPYTDKISKIGQPKATNKQFIGKKKGGTTWELRLIMCWLNPFFFYPLTNSQWIVADIFKKILRSLHQP